MQRILILLLTVSLFLTQQSNLHAQTDSTPPEIAPPETETIPQEPPVEEPPVEVPAGEAAPVEESGNNGGGGGGGAIIAVAVVAAAVVMVNRRGKLEKTFAKDDFAGSAITSFSNKGDKKLNWSIDYGSLSLASASSQGVENSKQLNQQQILNWRINRSLMNDWSAKANAGFSQNFDAQNESQLRQWLSVGVNKTNLFTANDRLSLTLGQRFNQGSDNLNEGFFLPMTLASSENTELFDLAKNTVESGRYINLSYIRSLGAQAALNLQLQFSPKSNPKQLDRNYMTLNWQYRY